MAVQKITVERTLYIPIKADSETHGACYCIHGYGYNLGHNFTCTNCIYDYYSEELKWEELKRENNAKSCTECIETTRR